jgi:multisubunit Na+/H+ antiporter MnhB subunit
MPTLFVTISVIFGLLYFAVYALLAIIGYRHAKLRDESLEAIGAVVPGLAGLLLAIAAVAAPSEVSICLAVLSLPISMFGRAVFELVVFGMFPSSRQRSSN